MISAIILAAGASTRMGEPKLLLPWGNVTVLEQVISTFASAGMEDILIVTGAAHEQLESAIRTYRDRYPIRSVHNEDFAAGEMLLSLQRGLRALQSEAVPGPEHQVEAALIALGDQPQVKESTIRRVCDEYRESGAALVVPSYRMRRGHPWLAARSLWKELLDLPPSSTPRDFLSDHADSIRYVNLDTSSILADLDTPEQYRESRP